MRSHAVVEHQRRASPLIPISPNFPRSPRGRAITFVVSSPRGAPAARAPPRRSLSRSTPSRLRFASLVSRHHHASTPSSSTTNSHANSHANSNSPQPSRYQKALDDTKAAVTLHYAHPPRTRRSRAHPPPASTTLKKKQRHHYLPQHATGPEYCTEARGGTVKYCN